MFSSCKKVSTIFMGSFEETALLPGISDILIVKWKNGAYVSTPFLVCFGSHTLLHKGKKASILVNKTLIADVQFTVDKYGYLHPMKPTPQQIKKMCLRRGKNQITFQLQHDSLSAEIYLYNEDDKLLISDFDGTMTKSDVRGLYNNFKGNDYLHENYAKLISTLQKNGYKIVWLTMRSLALYHFTKQYAKKFIHVDGVLLTQPEEFFPAVKKEVLKKTGNIKTNMMNLIKELFPSDSNPFAGGLGNRENDAIAYLAAGIPKEKIFIIDKQSQVHKLDENKGITYEQMERQIDHYFPQVKRKPKIGVVSKIKEEEMKKTSLESEAKKVELDSETFSGSFTRIQSEKTFLFRRK